MTCDEHTTSSVLKTKDGCYVTGAGDWAPTVEGCAFNGESGGGNRTAGARDPADRTFTLASP